jgi:hypothetical protein
LIVKYYFLACSLVLARTARFVITGWYDHTFFSTSRILLSLRDLSG